MSETNEERAAATAAKARGNSSAPAAEGLDRVRDILFGAQVRDQEERLTQLEDSLRTQFRRELSSMERQLESELGEARERLAAEARERTTGFEGLSTNLDALGESLKQSMQRLSLDVEKRQKALQEDLVQRTERLQEQLERNRITFEKALAEGLADLEERKADRGAIAGLLSEVAQQLQGVEK